MTESAIVLVVTAMVTQAVLSETGGVAEMRSVSGQMKQFAGLGGMVIAVTTTVCALINLLDTWVLTPYELPYLRVEMMVLLTVCGAAVAERVMKRGCADTFPHAGSTFALITGNCAVLGTAVLCVEPGQSFVQSVATGFSTAVAFTVAGILFAAIRGRISDEDLPLPVRGIPVLLLCGALISMALTGLNMLM